MSGTHSIIRQARLGDAAAIAEVHTACWQVAYRDLMPADVLSRVTVDRHEQEWALYLGRQPRDPERVWVALRPDRLVGFAHTAPSRDPDCDARTVAELVSLYVRPEAWRQGVGRVLTLACLDDARERAYDELTLWVLGENQRARRFYAGLGFLTDGTTELRSFGGARLLLMRYRMALAAARPAAQPSSDE